MCVSSSGTYWVEVLDGGVQVGADIDCATRRKAVAVAKRECKRYGLSSFIEYRTHSIVTAPIKLAGSMVDCGETDVDGMAVLNRT